MINTEIHYIYGDVSKGFVTTTSMLNAINVESTSASEFIKNEGISDFLNCLLFLELLIPLKEFLPPHSLIDIFDTYWYITFF